MLHFRHQLALPRDQIQRLEHLRAAFQREAIRRDAELRLAEMDLRALLEADPVDLTEVEVKLRAIERLRANLRLSRIQTIERGKAELTPEQRAKLKSLLATPHYVPLMKNPAGRPPHRRGGEPL